MCVYVFKGLDKTLQHACLTFVPVAVTFFQQMSSVLSELRFRNRPLVPQLKPGTCDDTKQNIVKHTQSTTVPCYISGINNEFSVHGYVSLSSLSPLSPLNTMKDSVVQHFIQC